MLLTRIRRWHVAVVGLGYVGLPLATAFARKGHRVLGIDVDSMRVKAVNEGRSYVEDVPSSLVRKLVRQGRLSATSSYEQLADAEAVIIAVPTPLDAISQPDLSYLTAAVGDVAPRLRPGALVVLESSTYPGTTEDLVRPVLEAARGQVGEDFYLAYSPERVNPGSDWPLEKIDKLIAGTTLACLERAYGLYSSVFPRLVRVSSPRVAEMAKLLENSQRLVNISFVNEMALLSDRLGVDIWEALEAAGTKPFGYTPYQPGPGAGGHCIPVDPLYLQWAVGRVNGESLLIEAAHQVNEAMPARIVDRLAGLFAPLEGRRFLVLGVAYKPNISDVRQSASVRLIAELLKHGAHVFYHDPHVPELQLSGLTLRSQPLTPALLREVDGAIIATDHDGVDYRRVVDETRWLLDLRNALAAFGSLPHVERL